MSKQQNTMEQVELQSLEVNPVEASRFSITLELKPERIQEPTTVRAGEGLGFQLTLSGTAEQALVIELEEPKVTIHYGQILPAAA